MLIPKNKNRIRTSVSVCMATYNGELYIKEQIDSILSQLIVGDELIIVDDKSSDDTCKFIKNYNSSFIKLYKNENNLGHCKSFERAISLSKNEYVFLADQDDIWPVDRVNLMLEGMKQSGCKVINGVAANFYGEKIDTSKLFFYKEYPTYGYFIELFKSIAGFRISKRMGCAMAFHSSLKKLLLPFPRTVTQHDIYIANVGNILKTYLYLPEIVLYHRIHDKNVSSKKRRKLYVIFKERFMRLMYLMIIIYRYFRAYDRKDKHAIKSRRY